MAKSVNPVTVQIHCASPKVENIVYYLQRVKKIDHDKKKSMYVQYKNKSTRMSRYYNNKRLPPPTAKMASLIPIIPPLGVILQNKQNKKTSNININNKQYFSHNIINVSASLSSSFPHNKV